MHEQMVRFATAQLRAGHLPLTSWFPFLGEGSPQFLHYQSLPAILTGALGLLIGPDVAFRWSLYLLLSLWPISVYLVGRARSGRAGRRRPRRPRCPRFWSAPPGSATSSTRTCGPGSESGRSCGRRGRCRWRGGSAGGRSATGAATSQRSLLTALTVALHFETGYLALSVLLVLAARRRQAARRPVAASRGPARRLAARVGVGDRPAHRRSGAWAARQRAAAGTGLVNGYGAGHVLDWLVSGQLLDHGRLPVVTVFAALGFGLAWLAWSSDADARALLVALAVCLLLAFGRTTFGSLVDLIPGSGDIFFRRFMMGVQLAALLLAGRGAAWLAAGCVRLLEARVPRWPPGLSVAAVLVGAARSRCSRPRGFSSAPTTAMTTPRSRPSAARTTPRAPSSIGSSR